MSTSGWGDAGSVDERSGGSMLCGACIRLGACRLGMQDQGLGDDGALRAAVVCSSEHEGGPNVAHGGWTAAVMDELLGHVPLHHDQLTVTGTLTVRFVRPVPIGRDLIGRAWRTKVDGVKWHLAGELRLASTDALLAEAHGVWIARDRATHFAAHEAWLLEQESGPP